IPGTIPGVRLRRSSVWDGARPGSVRSAARASSRCTPRRAAPGEARDTARSLRVELREAFEDDADRAHELGEAGLVLVVERLPIRAVQELRAGDPVPGGGAHGAAQDRAGPEAGLPVDGRIEERMRIGVLDAQAL